jgi:hypothetical protein
MMRSKTSCGSLSMMVTVDRLMEDEGSFLAGRILSLL